VLATLEPVFTIVWAVLLLGESLSAAQVTGASLVLVGVVWSQASLAQ
jgi:drug/metabolite transporter (DMT)-like permease